MNNIKKHKAKNRSASRRTERNEPMHQMQTIDSVFLQDTHRCLQGQHKTQQNIEPFSNRTTNTSVCLSLQRDCVRDLGLHVFVCAAVRE